MALVWPGRYAGALTRKESSPRAAAFLLLFFSFRQTEINSNGRKDREKHAVDKLSC